jgi:hypothetical protein
MFSSLPDNPFAAVVVALLVILFGVGGGGAVLALRRDERQSKKDEVDLTELMRRVAADTISDLQHQLEESREERDVLTIRIRRAEKRIATLENQLDWAHESIRAAVAYASALLAYIAVHLPHREDIPHVPSSLREHFHKNRSEKEETGERSQQDAGRRSAPRQR